MKIATAEYKTESQKAFGAKPIKLALISYDSNTFSAAETTIIVEGITFNPWIESISAIRYSLDEFPGLGKASDCEIKLVRNSSTDNLLTGKSRGKRLLLYQWFEGLLYADRITIADLILDEISEIMESTFVARYIAPESKLTLQLPTASFDKTVYPELLDENIGSPAPFIFGDFSKLNDDQNKEYIQANRPDRVPVPIFWSSLTNRELLAHRGPDASFPFGTREVMQWIEPWRTYALCRYSDTTNKLWATSSANKTSPTRVETLVTFNDYATGGTANGQGRYVCLLPDQKDVSNSVTDYQKAIDTDSTTVATIGAGQTLGLLLSRKEKVGEMPNAFRYHKICFDVRTVSAGGLLNVWDGRRTTEGLAWSDGTWATGINTTGFKEISVTVIDSQKGDFENYFIRLINTGTASVTVDGVYVKFAYVDTIFRTSASIYQIIYTPGIGRGEWGRATL